MSIGACRGSDVGDRGAEVQGVTLCAAIENVEQLIGKRISTAGRMERVGFEFLGLTDKRCPRRALPVTFGDSIQGDTGEILLSMFSLEEGKVAVNTDRTLVLVKVSGLIHQTSDPNLGPVFEIEGVSSVLLEETNR